MKDWPDLVQVVRSRHPQLVRGWFTSLTPREMEQGTLPIDAQNHAQAKYLEQFCLQAFTEAAQAVTGRLVSVRFNSPAEDAEPVPGAPLMGEHDEELVLNPEHSFSNFVVGPDNRLAHAAAVAVTERPGEVYNPLFIHSPTGLGKTHLVHAICQAVREQQPGHRCCCISCETLVNQLIEALEAGALHHFRDRYRHVDVLAVDDIQFLARGDQSQEEFFHTFNTLYQFRRQIVLTSDRSPSELSGLEDRLVSRFQSGLVVTMDFPDLETRAAIVRKKARLRCIEIPDDALLLIADSVESNIRELEGILHKVDIFSQTLGRPVTVELVREALSKSAVRPVPVHAIMELVAARMNVKVSDLQSRRRSRACTWPRHLCMYIVRQLTPLSLEEIGGYFGGRDHTTVLHADRMVSKRLKEEEPVQILVQELLNEARGRA